MAPNPDDRRLIVEGPGDLYFIAELWRKQIGTDAKKSFKIFKQGGKENLIHNLANREDATIWKRKSMTHLGIVIDADKSAGSALQSVSDALTRAGYTGFPRELDPSGSIRTIDDLRIGVWIMPDNAAPGMVEDLFLSLLPGEPEQQRSFAKQTLDQLESQKLHRYNAEFHRNKALTHTILAWQREPGIAMGLAVKENDVSLPTEKLPLVDWLKRLFSQD